MKAYKIALGLSIAGVGILLWMSLGIGIIGEDGNPNNRVYFIIPAIGILGALLSRLKPSGLALTLATMALSQAIIAIVAVLRQAGMPWSGPGELLLLNGFFILLFILSALLFRRSRRF